MPEMTPELLVHLTPEQQTLELDRYELEPPAGDIIGDLLLELAKAKQAWAADLAELAGELREIGPATASALCGVFRHAGNFQVRRATP